MEFPQSLKYTKTHEWVKQDGDSLLVGISEAAQDMLGEIVFVGEVKVGESLAAGDTAGVVESVKAASDIYAPVDGEILEFNGALETEPQKLNQSPYELWIYRMKPRSMADLDRLLDPAAYQATLGAEK
ncbi:MAG: glycine cleavage system protein GcvH [Betaproteobacteria bacterium]|nr:glycine cleavage system protein GcvH [Betaproteobacteria bacterium]